jgi:uncharacterized heparinase superfamily protein
LIGNTPAEPPVFPLPAPLGGNPAQAERLLTGELSFGGQTILNPVPLCYPPHATPAWRRELGCFAWVRDLHAQGSGTARRVAQLMVQRWLAEDDQFQGEAWRLDLVARRLATLLLFYTYLDDGTAEGRLVLLQGVARHDGHLRHALPGGLGRIALAQAAVSLILTGMLLPRRQASLRRGLQIFKRALGLWGGEEPFGQRNGTALLDLLELLGAVMLAARLSGRSVPEIVRVAGERLAATIAVLIHADGTLAQFHGARADDPARIRAILATFAPHPGTEAAHFQRLQAGRSTVILDVGAPPADAAAHSSPLAFEFSHDGEKIVTNCGACDRSAEWQIASRHAAAHSVLILNGQDGMALPVYSQAMAPHVLCRRDENQGRIWVDAHHQGYHEHLGAEVRRRLYLDQDGQDLRGEDIVTGPSGLSFVIRFHLMPEIDAVLARDGFSVLLTCPSGRAFRLRTSQGPLRLEDSFYCADGLNVWKSRQLTVMGASQEGETRVLWALSREA